MPLFQDFPYPKRYNSLRLLGYGYNSTTKLCAITMVTDLHRPIFADINLAKSVLTSLISDTTLAFMRVKVFTLMPDHLHLLAGVRQPEVNLPTLLGRFKSYTTQQYWKLSHEIVESSHVNLPPKAVDRTDPTEAKRLLQPILEWRATLRPEMMELRNWPSVKPAQFLKKRLWREKFFDHVIRNDIDLQENIDYIIMNPVKAGFVTRPEFYPFTGFMY